MPAVAGLALVILLVIGVLNILLMPVPAPGATEVISIVVGIISGILQAFVVAPLAIAVHRYVLLGEVTPGYALDPSNPRYMRFVGFAILVKLLLAAPSLVIALPMAIAAAPTGLTTLADFLTAILPLSSRSSSSGAPSCFRRSRPTRRAPTGAARNDTMGNSWRVAFILVCAMVPILVLSLPIYFLLRWPPQAAGVFARIVLAIISTVLQIVSICTLAAAASHTFRALADRLASRPGTAPA